MHKDAVVILWETSALVPALTPDKVNLLDFWKSVVGKDPPDALLADVDENARNANAESLLLVGRRSLVVPLATIVVRNDDAVAVLRWRDARESPSLEEWLPVLLLLVVLCRENLRLLVHGIVVDKPLAFGLDFLLLEILVDALLVFDFFEFGNAVVEPFLLRVRHFVVVGWLDLDERLPVIGIRLDVKRLHVLAWDELTTTHVVDAWAHLVGVGNRDKGVVFTKHLLKLKMRRRGFGHRHSDVVVAESIRQVLEHDAGKRVVDVEEDSPIWKTWNTKGKDIVHLVTRRIAHAFNGVFTMNNGDGWSGERHDCEK